MSVFHVLGFPRIGAQRELKFAVESYWKGDINAEQLEQTGKELRLKHWDIQAKAGAKYVTVGDFAWYDQILEWTTLLGAVPARFKQEAGAPVSLDTLFRLGRGRAPSGEPAAACEMTKWFDTNYHYIVPELSDDQDFYLARESLFNYVKEAQSAGHNVKVVIPGPLSYLWLSKGANHANAQTHTDGDCGCGHTHASFSHPADVAKLKLLPKLVAVYKQVLAKLKAQGVEWVQIDEPILATELDATWKDAFAPVYADLAKDAPKVLVATYFDDLATNLNVLTSLSVQGIHLDFVRGPAQLNAVLPLLGDKVLSAGVVNGRNIWRTDLDKTLAFIKPAKEALGDRLWLSSSCSLQHVPVDLSFETELDSEVKSWLSFAVQKIDEVALLSAALNGELNAEQKAAWQEQAQALAARAVSPRLNRADVAQRVAASRADNLDREAFADRIAAQQEALNLPLFPTTTIGSFPQTTEIRSLRRQWRSGQITDSKYEADIRAEIEHVIRVQEDLDLDVLVHGEPERNDMVEYFGELLAGFAFTRNGWVQSYGSRCVKPPVIFADVVRVAPMTVGWTSYAQSLTNRPVKGMLTGPVTILQWSFVRDDVSRETVCRQLGLALNDEVLDLEKAGISVIQIDEPAFREGLPIKRSQWKEALEWAVDCFKLSSIGVQKTTQIHTHMCYSEFNDIIDYIAKMDADVITIETSRSNMELLQAFEEFRYPNDIGPGVYDIHSPNVPKQEWMVELIEKAVNKLPKERVWVNPDCGLKTRGWPETKAALAEMVAATKTLRARYSAN